MRIKNWSKYQHYKHRRPPWIKLHRSLLDDPEWFALSGDASKLLANCWLIASEFNGELPPMKDIAFRLRMKMEELEALISELDHWLEADASTTLADCKHDASMGDPQSKSKSQRESKEIYRFSGNVIRVTDKDYNRWSKSYSNLNLTAELQSLDDWISTQPTEVQNNWFWRISGALKNRNNAAKPKPAPKIAPQFRTSVEEVSRPPENVISAQMAEWERTKREIADAMVRSDDEGAKGKPRQPKPKKAGLRHLLPASPPMDHAQEDEAEADRKALPN